MRIASFLAEGRQSFGVLDGEKIIDCGSLLSGRYRGIRDVLEHDALDELRTLADGASADYALTDVDLLPTVPDPGKIICIGVNYHDHREEASRKAADHPTVFPRYADSQVGHGSPLVKPRETAKFDYEGELAVVIGRPGRRIDTAAAFDHVAGYSCYNDGSVRDWQRHTGQWLPGKTFPGTGAFGPALVTADEVPDVGALRLTTKVNGELRQSAEVADLVFDIPAVIAYVSTFTRLDPGDVIVTGTPGGVGLFRDPPTFLQAGDTVSVEVSGIGTLVNPVTDEAL